jgi:hypothetical protein
MIVGRHRDLIAEGGALVLVSDPIRAWYGRPISDFVRASDESVLGALAMHGEFALEPAQRDAWLGQLPILRSSLSGLSGTILLEYNIPRMGRRIDAVLLVGPAVFAVEFKVGEKAFERSAIEQVWDYALDLKNFHKASHTAAVIPILVATEATSSPHIHLHADADGVFRPVRVHPAKLRPALDEALATLKGATLEPDGWLAAPYHPTPTILEAARALYAHHSVEAIARFDAGAKNLAMTSKRIEEIIDEAKARNEKAICFVTGVPGAGKTLVGLNVATRRRKKNEPTHAVFLSGNGPLVAVLSEALIRDEVERLARLGEKVRKGVVAQKVKAFIQNVHHFRDAGLADETAPVDHVVIFDEAQRAWNLRKTADFMRRKKNRAGFAQSEPEFLVSYMDRHDWAVIICLVGGGQEIYDGEAGIGAWLDALNKSFPHWHVYISPRLHDSEYAAGNALASIANRKDLHLEAPLHLAVSMRSFRSEKVSTFVKAVLDREAGTAKGLLGDLVKRFPIAITRDLGRAKEWIRNRARGSERYGVLASSKAQRLKPHAIDIRVKTDPVQWFLKGKNDTRSSFYLEDAATEFQVQGLELDWTLVTWDGDLRYSEHGWSYHDFRGDRWTNVNNADNRNYLRNAYRVLLTRARQGMVIFVPPPDESDHTRAAGFYDPTYKYLTSIGIPVLD